MGKFTSKIKLLTFSKFFSPSGKEPDVAGGLGPDDNAAKETELTPYQRSINQALSQGVFGGVGAYQQQTSGAPGAVTGQQNFFGTDWQRIQYTPVSWADLTDAYISVDPAAPGLYYGSSSVEQLANIQRAGVGVPEEPAVRVDPIFTELAVGMYSLAVSYAGTHNCSLGDDPLLDRLPLRLAEELFKLSQLLKGRCLFSPQGRELVKTVLDVANAGSYKQSAQCDKQQGPLQRGDGCNESRSET
jgi:hypothetical protein